MSKENIYELPDCKCNAVNVHYPTNFPVQGGTRIHEYEVCNCGGKREVSKPLDYIWYKEITDKLDKIIGMLDIVIHRG